MTRFFRLLDVPLYEKAAALRDAIGGNGAREFNVNPSAFAHIPGTPFAYWVGDRVRKLFLELPPFESNERTARVGLQTGDDFRFVRTWWEIDPHKKNKIWFNFAKGGSYSPFYSDTHLDVNWQHDGSQISSFVDLKTGKIRSRPQNTEYYFRPGLTWSDRTTKRFSARVWPEGGVFSVKGSAGFFKGEEFFACAIMNSTAFYGLISMLVGAGDAAARSYQVGVIGAVPYPRFDQSLAALAKRGWYLKRRLDTADETSHAFLLPSPLLRKISGFDSVAIESELQTIQLEIDDGAFRLYELDDADRTSIEAWTRNKAAEDTGVVANESVSDETEDAEEDSQSGLDESSSMLSWAVGISFGRFDIRLATGERAIPPDPEPFDLLPAKSPGMLPNGDAPFMQCSGVLVDDQGHENDFVAHVAAVYDHVGEPAPEPDVLRRTLARDFFPAHIKMYSKSRRKAPIYWQLATPSASYSVWLYVQAFTKDTLLRVQNDYVVSKLAHEQRQLEAIRVEAEQNPSGPQHKSITAMEVYVEELQAFLEMIKRAVPLWNPNLDDGVIINFAPLWRLVPQHKSWQNELKTTWNALCAGAYDWTHLAMHLWPERVVQKCAENRNLAIAHGLEEIFWFKDEEGKWTPYEEPQPSIADLVRERTSTAVKAALKSLLDVPEPASGAKRSRKSKAA